MNQPLNFSTPDDGEEIARAEVYGLLAALFVAPPTPELYASLQVAVTEAPAAGAFLESNWSALVAAARRLPLAAVGDEYAALFQGIGKPEVFLYGSWFIAGHLNEKPLVDLRHALAALGLERPAGVLLTERPHPARVDERLCGIDRGKRQRHFIGNHRCAADRSAIDPITGHEYG